MKNFKINNQLVGLLVAASLALTACGSGSNVGGSLAGGVVGTLGDGVNEEEYAAIAKGMNKEQIITLVGDQPTSVAPSGAILAWKNSNGTFSDVLLDGAENAIGKSASTSDGTLINHTVF
ncbi:MAG: hypothetical protein Q7K57_11345 [Burkholderiaceae bacterium]|nr:hypothetical protein [Burkholderiaceae bacterium]